MMRRMTENPRRTNGLVGGDEKEGGGANWIGYSM